MLKLKKIAITGGLSCGKSSVCRILEELGAYVISADKIVHQLLSSDAILSQEIVDLLGPSVLINQKLDRSHIAHIVFQNIELLKALEALVHPRVYKELNKEYQKQQNCPHPPSLFVAEIPLLFESNEQKNYDCIVAVIANPDICFERFEQATGKDQKEFNYRMARQRALFEKARLADYVIINNGTLSDLQQTTVELYQKLIET
jgi:dephospho-CoA kinase